MATAAVTPRVRTIVICDNISARSYERGVFTLEGVRHQLRGRGFPLRADLIVFMALTSARKGEYPGRILVVSERTDRVVRYLKFHAAFEQDNEWFQGDVAVDECVFPEPGLYRFEIYFSTRDGGGDALKGEQPFVVRGK